MARFFTDFSEYETGLTPYDWRERWVLGGQTLTVEEAADATGGKVLRHEVLEDERRAWSWELRGASTVEVVTRARAQQPGARFGVIGRGAGSGPHRHNEDGFVPELEAEGRFVTRSYDRRYVPEPDRTAHGTGHTIGTSDVGWETDTWYWIRLRLTHHDDGVHVASKVWGGDADDEPEGWVHEEAAAQPPYVGADGWFGIQGQRAAGPREYDVFGVGTDGDTAPTGC